MNAAQPHAAGLVRVNLAGKVAVVTGASGGMGWVLAGELARAGAHVVTVARDAHRTKTLIREVVGQGRPGGFEVVEADLSLRDGVIDAAAAISKRHEQLHLLVNNAGAHFPDRRLTPDGVEMHVAVDYLAAFGLTHLLKENLIGAAGRVVNIASETLNDTRQVKLFGRARPATLDVEHIEDLTSLNPATGFVAFEAYARAKLLTVTSGYYFARLLRPHAVTVNSVHPGIVATDIIDDLVPSALRPLAGVIRKSLLTPQEGAWAGLRLATDPALATVTGRYYNRAKETTTPAISHDPDIQQRLHDLSSRWFERRSAH